MCKREERDCYCKGLLCILYSAADLAWNVPTSSALSPTTRRMEPSLSASTAGVPGISWYCRILDTDSSDN